MHRFATRNGALPTATRLRCVAGSSQKRRPNRGVGQRIEETAERAASAQLCSGGLTVNVAPAPSAPCSTDLIRTGTVRTLSRWFPIGPERWSWSSSSSGTDRLRLHRQFVVRPAGAALFPGTEQGQGRQAPVRSGGQQLRELGKRSHGGDVVQHKGQWWVEATGG